MQNTIFFLTLFFFALSSKKKLKVKSMSKDLIIVESPAKVKTIKKFLGNNYTIQASVGHIRDLPSRELGVDEKSFEPKYVTIQGKEKVVQGLQEAAKKADIVYLAPDPDREGEAIAWHIAQAIKNCSHNIKRIQFNEITAKAVKDAIAHPREIDPNLFEAQQARRILDRLVGYKISPLLWKSVKRGISAGRVQSVALRLIVEREEERLAFVPEEFWNFKAQLTADGMSFKAELAKVNGKKVQIQNEEQALAIEKALQTASFIVESVEEKERSKAPQAPFTTSTLQQAANQRLGFSAKRTMNTAQRLYEGIDIEDKGTVALITYMRTDSVRIADEAKAAAKEFIEQKYGKNFIASGGKGRDFKGKKSIQDAHEAIRPVDVTLTPDQVKSALTPDQYRLYNLIWSRFVASQMANAKFHDTAVSIVCNNKEIKAQSDVEKEFYPLETQWKTKGERLLFAGFLTVLASTDEKVEELPKLTANDVLGVEQISKEQKFTQPSPRYTEASLVRELEEKGIGRPSTYATIISTIQDREYVRLDGKHFVPTDLGNVVCSQLRDNFPTLMDVGFTAKMEENLDKVADGEMGWVKLLTDFSGDFNSTLAKAGEHMKAIKSGVETSMPCPKCGKPLTIKFGKSGEFLACSGYPACTFTSNFIRNEQGEIELQAAPEQKIVGKCPKCGGNTVEKRSHTGARFIACSNYPKCDYAAPFSTGVTCPQCKTGVLVEKSTKRGKLFYSCSTYPKCDYALWDYPVPEHCPVCDSPILVRKNTKANGEHYACPNKSCTYKRIIGEDGEEFEPSFVQIPLLPSQLPQKADIPAEERTAKNEAKAQETIIASEKPKRTRKTKASEADTEKAAKASSKTAKTTQKAAEETEDMPEQSVLDHALKAEKVVNLYTDGSCLGNPGKGGYGAILEFKGKKQELTAGFARTTNNRMELLGVITGLNKLKEACNVNIYTDSQYVAKAIKQNWLENWKKNGWKTANKKPVKNQDLWIALDTALSHHNVTFHWIKGHAGHPENERCDELARTSAGSEYLAEDAGFQEE